MYWNTTPAQQAAAAKAERARSQGLAQFGRNVDTVLMGLGSMLPGMAPAGEHPAATLRRIQNRPAGPGFFGAGVPPAATAPAYKAARDPRFANSRQSNLDRINADPRFGAGAATLGSAPSAPYQQTAVVVPAQRSRDAELNAASQQAGGPNLSKPLIPTEAELAAQKDYAAARAANPLAEVPELLDQRSQAYGQRADIQAWLKAMESGSASDRAIAQRFRDKQRKAVPQTAAEMPEMTQSFGGEGATNAYDAKRLEAYEQSTAPQQSVNEAMAAFTPRDMSRFPLNPVRQELEYSDGGAPTNPWTPADAPSAPPSAGAVVGEKWYGKVWDGSNWVDALPVSGGAPAQDGNLNNPESPLPDANLAQSFTDQKKKALLEKYLPQAAAFNTVRRG